MADNFTINSESASVAFCNECQKHNSVVSLSAFEEYCLLCNSAFAHWWYIHDVLKKLAGIDYEEVLPFDFEDEPFFKYRPQITKLMDSYLNEALCVKALYKCWDDAIESGEYIFREIFQFPPLDGQVGEILYIFMDIYEAIEVRNRGTLSEFVHRRGYTITALGKMNSCTSFIKRRPGFKNQSILGFDPHTYHPSNPTKFTIITDFTEALERSEEEIPEVNVHGSDSE